MKRTLKGLLIFSCAGCLLDNVKDSDLLQRKNLSVKFILDNPYSFLTIQGIQSLKYSLNS